ncbi:MAG: GAF domain-containing protein, partial [Methylibium sp.]|nr:GAF domain-containing protein [Methylibium sp.]
MPELGALIRQLQSQFVRSAEPHRVFDALLPELLRLGESEYGFIAEVWRQPDGAPYLKIFTLSNIAWDTASRERVERERVDGMEFHNLKTLFGAALVTGEPVIANDAPNDPRRGGGLPHGHLALNTFLGVPLHYGSELVGMIGLANRQPGYDAALLDTLDPLFQSMAGIIASVQLDRQRRAAESALRASEERWRHSFEMAGAGIA